jgi:hypothetical protein
VVDGSRFDEFKAALWHHAGVRLCPHPRHPVRHHRQQWRAVFRKCGQGRALRRAVLAAQDPACVPAEHHRLHGRQGVRVRRHRQGRRQAGDGCCDHLGAQGHHADRRLVWRGQLRHVRAGLCAALSVDLAEQPHLGHGRRAGGGRAGNRQARWHRAQGGTWSAEEEAEFKRPTLEMFAEQSHPLYASAR